MRRKRIGGDDNAIYGDGVQGRLAWTLGVALAGFRQIDDGRGDCTPGRLNVSLTVQGCDGGLESNPHDTRNLGIESVTFQVGSDWHGGEQSTPNFLPAKWKRPIVRAF